MTEIKVNQQDYTESTLKCQKDYTESTLKCQKCDEQLLLFVHKNNKQHTVTLGCGLCGHVNKIKLSEGDNNE